MTDKSFENLAKFKLYSCQFCSFQSSSVTSSLTCPNILLCTLLMFIANAADHVSHPYKQQQHYTAIYLQSCHRKW